MTSKNSSPDANGSPGSMKLNLPRSNSQDLHQMPGPVASNARYRHAFTTPGNFKFDRTNTNQSLFSTQSLTLGNAAPVRRSQTTNLNLT